MTVKKVYAQNIMSRLVSDKWFSVDRIQSNANRDDDEQSGSAR